MEGVNVFFCGSLEDAVRIDSVGASVVGEGPGGGGGGDVVGVGGVDLDVVHRLGVPGGSNADHAGGGPVGVTQNIAGPQVPGDPSRSDSSDGQWFVVVDDMAVVDREEDGPGVVVLRLDVEDPVLEVPEDDAVIGQSPAPPAHPVRVHARRRAVGGEDGEAGLRVIAGTDRKSVV